MSFSSGFGLLSVLAENEVMIVVPVRDMPGAIQRVDYSTCKQENLFPIVKIEVHRWGKIADNHRVEILQGLPGVSHG